jgi:hypothetical protein
MTATDMIVRAKNLPDIGDYEKVASIAETEVQGSKKAIHKLLSVSIL